MTKREKRIIEVYEMLKSNKRLHVSAVAESLNVSEATVRRFFSDLERDGKVIRTHGGIQIAPHGDYLYSFEKSSQHRVHQKAAIGRAAAEHISSYNNIFLDSGTTVIKLAEAIAINLRSKVLSNVVVVTTSLNVADVLGDYCRVILIGGEVRLRRRDVRGSLAMKILSRFQINKAFLGVDGISIENGLMTTDEDTANLNELTIEKASESYVLADSEKFNRDSFINYAPVTAVDLIITNDELDQMVVNAFASAGAKIRVVKTETQAKSPDDDGSDSAYGAHPAAQQ